MGRRETPVRTSSKALSELALLLRSQRQTSGLTYAQLAAVTGTSASSLSRATKGERLPSLAVVEAFAIGCGTDKRKAVTLWRKARYSTIQRTDPKSDQAPLMPQYIHNFAQLHVAMVELYRRAGSPPLRWLESTPAGQHGRLPRSSVSRVLRGQAIPRKELLVAFVQACATSGRVDTDVWAAAWEQASQKALYDRDVRRSRTSIVDAVGLRSALVAAEDRLKQLTEVRAAHNLQRAEILASYRALPGGRLGSHYRVNGFLEEWAEGDESQGRKQELLQQLINADAAVGSVQNEMDELGVQLAALRRRLKSRGANSSREDV
jgi:transcriptional regulator with XRE-family HTH domain